MLHFSFFRRGTPQKPVSMDQYIFIDGLYDDEGEIADS